MADRDVRLPCIFSRRKQDEIIDASKKDYPEPLYNARGSR
jgi:hypothetical protein